MCHPDLLTSAYLAAAASLPPIHIFFRKNYEFRQRIGFVSCFFTGNLNFVSLLLRMESERLVGLEGVAKRGIRAAGPADGGPVLRCADDALTKRAERVDDATRHVTSACDGDDERRKRRR